MALEMDEMRRRPLLVAGESPVVNNSSSNDAGKEDRSEKSQKPESHNIDVEQPIPCRNEADESDPPSSASTSVPRSQPTTTTNVPLRLTRVKVDGKAVINRIELSYSDGSMWAMGAPTGGAKKAAQAGKNKKNEGFRPLVLTEDEFIIEVQHESLVQWWWVGAAIQFTTNKGRMLQTCGFWSSGLQDNTKTFRASPGSAILGLRLHNGTCHGVIEGPAPDVEESELKLWAVYWLPEGAANDEVQNRNFAGRETALRFAERVGGGRETALQLGPLRVALTDHPWLDCCRDLRELFRVKRLASLDSREVADTSESYVEVVAGDDRSCAGVVLDLVASSRIKAWGVHTRRKCCEEQASENGQFNLKRWRDMSLSLADTIEQVRLLRPALERLFVMMDLKRHVVRTALTAAIAAVTSTCDSIRTVLSGAVFTLINAQEEEVKRDSKFLHIVCSWTFGCDSRLSLSKSLILALMMLATFRGAIAVVSQHVSKAFKDSYRVQSRIELFDHLLVQDVEEFEKNTAKVMASKASPMILDSMPTMIVTLVSDVVSLCTCLVFLYSISPLLTFLYATLVPAIQVAAQAYLRKQARGQHADIGSEI